tara:strand:+ start:1495 stop:2160 length:666 start_codon:yes stop_codon:yes gene_type:complete
MNYKTIKLISDKYSLKEITLRSKKFYDRIKKRRSIREFSTKKINDKIIETAVLSAASAPNGANLQPWHFAIIKDKKIKKKIRKAAEKEEIEFYNNRAPQEWLEALKPLGTDYNKKFIEDAPVIIAIFEEKYSFKNKKKIKNYYVKESVGIATGILISNLHYSGLSMLTHTPSPMNFLNKILNRPANEKPFVLLILGFPTNDCRVPKYASQKKKLKEITSWH